MEPLFRLYNHRRLDEPHSGNSPLFYLDSIYDPSRCNLMSFQRDPRIRSFYWLMGNKIDSINIRVQKNEFHLLSKLANFALLADFSGIPVFHFVYLSLLFLLWAGQEYLVWHLAIVCYANFRVCIAADSNTARMIDSANAFWTIFGEWQKQASLIHQYLHHMYRKLVRLCFPTKMT